MKNATCLDEKKLDEFIRTANARQLSKVWVNTYNVIYNWGMYSLEDVFDNIAKKLPEIYAFVNVDELKRRLYDIQKNRVMETPDCVRPSIFESMPLGFKSEPKIDIPEIVTVRNKFRDAFISVPSGIEKAEAWLYPYALNAGADADLEALVYFKSKGETLIPPSELSEKWRVSICRDVEMDQDLNKTDKKIIRKAKKRNLSLVELSELFKKSILKLNFLCPLDNEEEFITSTFFRAMEWFQLNEYEPWADVFAQDISTMYQGGVDQECSLYPLFYFCRSDLLLRRASKFGLEALLHGVCVGSIDTSKPWKRYWVEPSKTHRDFSYVDYLPTASIIAFAWQRINPMSINREILDHALLLIFQTQLTTGAWPLTSKDSDGCILSTCLAITALSVVKPEGYQRYVSKAIVWLQNQQNAVGCWNIDGAPAVMINILCLEAIKLAEGINQITYTVCDSISGNSQIQSSTSKPSANMIVFCEGDPDGTKNVAFDENCYTKIFSSEFPNTVFCSSGSCKDIETPNLTLMRIIRKVNPYHTIIRLIDRDDRSEQEIANLKEQGINVLSLRELESYLLDDEIIDKLCIVCDQAEKSCEIRNIKTKSLEQSIVRGNPPDDIKSAAGLFVTEAKKALKLTRCGNDTVNFLRDTMAPLVTKETKVYQQLKQDIFGE